MEIKALDIADFLKGTVQGDKNILVSSFSKIEEGKPGSLSFLANPKYEKYIYDTEASVVVVSNDFIADHPVKCTLIRVADAYGAFAALLDFYEKTMEVRYSGIEEPSFVAPTATLGNDIYVGAFAYIGENAEVGDNVKIYPQVFVGRNVKVGTGTIIYSGAKIYDNTVIGTDCIVHAGVVIGSDGFGFARAEGGSYKKVPQLGNVVIEDNVEIGANSTVDRSTMGSTIIKKGVKLDNLIQVGHNCEIGENTVIAALTGIAGSTKIGGNCMIAGHVGIAGHINVGDNVTIGAFSGVPNNIKPGSIVMGAPAMKHDRALKTFVVYRNLPELRAQVLELQKEIAELKSLLKK